MNRSSGSRWPAWLVLVLLAGCAAKGPGPMYLWDSFPTMQYQALLREGASPDEQIRTMQAQADKAAGANAKLPPGFRAHLGMMYLSSGNPDKARNLWNAEKLAFPESAAGTTS